MRMMTRNRNIGEALSALHLTFASVSTTFHLRFGSLAPFIGMERGLNAFIGLPYSDFTRGYFAIWIPTVVLALLVWVGLRRSGILVSRYALALTIATPLIVWILIGRNPWHYGITLPVIELLAVVVSRIVLNRCGVKSLLKSVQFSCILLHFGFWYFLTESDPSFPGYDGPFGPILGACAAACVLDARLQGKVVSNANRTLASSAPVTRA